jgi:hypothetical protein
MTHKLDIEAALDRSLANQVKAPRLDRRFDAAVWARIEATQQPAATPVIEGARVQSSARWLFAVNVIGAAVAVALIFIFGVQPFAQVTVPVPAPQISLATSMQIINVAGQVLGGIALVFGLMYTPIGRRLRAELT